MHTLWNEDETVVILDDELGLEFGANARLIAAAPDLLAALEELYEAHQLVEHGDEDYPRLEAAQAQARAAIAKAKGED
jgi:uncharacterized cupin superfamily protein